MFFLVIIQYYNTAMTDVHISCICLLLSLNPIRRTINSMLGVDVVYAKVGRRGRITTGICSYIVNVVLTSTGTDFTFAKFSTI